MSTGSTPSIVGKPRAVSVLIVVGAVLDAAPPHGIFFWPSKMCLVQDNILRRD